MLADFAQKNSIELTVVGPEAFLAQGIVDVFHSRGLRIFGPTKKAARLETSKSWALQFMKKHGLPHPQFAVFHDMSSAKKFIKNSPWLEFVIKADGLALGKGVIIAGSKKEAFKGVDAMAGFGEAGKTFVIQEKLQGYEVSVVAFTDGKTIVSLLPAQDYKRIFDGDCGPNTGGMGAYAPIPAVDKKLTALIQKNILQPFLQGVIKDKLDYRGVIYPGLMITKEGPKVLEFNARFGDPETQPQMMLLESDLLEIMEASISGNLKKRHVRFKKGAAMCVVLASKGYPGAYQKGETIYGLNRKYSGVEIFQAGTKIKEGKIVTAGGRVLGVTGYGANIKQSLKATYAAIGKRGVNFAKMQYRRDIGLRALTAIVR